MDDGHVGSSPDGAEASTTPVQTALQKQLRRLVQDAANSTAVPTESSGETDVAPATLNRHLFKLLLQVPRIGPWVKRRHITRLNKQFAEQAVRVRSQNDPADNAATRLPVGEQARAPVIWLAEVFTPTTIDNLVKGLRALQAKIEGSFLNETDDLAESVLTARRQGGLSFRPAIHVTTKKSPLFARRAVDTLPAGIEYIHLQLLTLTSTVTVLTATFRLDKEAERHLETILNEDRITTARMNKGLSFTVPDVASQKVEAVDEWRSTLRSNAAKWMAARFPGFFCRMSSEQLPTIELMLTNSYAPWEATQREVFLNSGPQWTRIIDLVHFRGYWESRGASPLRMNSSMRGGERHSLTIATTENNLLARSPNTDLHEALAMLDSSIPFLLGLWSLNAFLSELDEQMPSLQDVADRTGLKNSPRALKNVQRQLLRSGLDSRIVANEITTYSDAPIRRFGSPDFSEVLHTSNGPKHQSGSSLLDSWAMDRTARGKRIVEMEKDLREVLSTNANLGLQRAVYWLTIFSVGVAVIAAIAAIVSVLLAMRSSNANRDSPAGYSTATAHSKSVVTHPRASLIPSPTASASTSP